MVCYQPGLYVGFTKGLMKSEEVDYCKKKYGVKWGIQKRTYVVPKENAAPLREELKERRLKEKLIREELVMKKYREISKKWDLIAGSVFHISLNNFFKDKYSLTWNVELNVWLAPKGKDIYKSILNEVEELNKEIVSIHIPDTIIEIDDRLLYTAIMRASLVRRSRGNKGKVPKRFYKKAEFLYNQEWFEISDSYLNNLYLGENYITANSIIRKWHKENEEKYCKLNIIQNWAMVAHYPKSLKTYFTNFYYIPTLYKENFEDEITNYLKALG
jgi:hypothetical protein